jgi:hypothetical protein
MLASHPSRASSLRFLNSLTSNQAASSYRSAEARANRKPQGGVAMPGIEKSLQLSLLSLAREPSDQEPVGLFVAVLGRGL